MSAFDPSCMMIDQLVDHFVQNCVEQDKALLYDEFDEFRVQYEEMDAISKELTRRGVEARLALQRLYGHKNMQMRLQAARFTLAVAPIAARNEIQAVADSRHEPQAFDARSSLRGLDDGFYKPV